MDGQTNKHETDKYWNRDYHTGLYIKVNIGKTTL